MQTPTTLTATHSYKRLWMRSARSVLAAALGIASIGIASIGIASIGIASIGIASIGIASARLYAQSAQSAQSALIRTAKTSPERIMAYAAEEKDRSTSIHATAPQQQRTSFQTALQSAFTRESATRESATREAATREPATREILSEPVIVPIQDAEPFLTLSANAQLVGANEQNVRVWIRTQTSHDASSSQSWSQWTEATTDNHGVAETESVAQQGGQNGQEGRADALSSRSWTSRLFFLSKDTRAVQVKIQLSKTAIFRTPAMRDFTLHWCSPGATPQAELSAMEALANADGYVAGQTANHISTANQKPTQKPTQKPATGRIQALVARPAFTSRTDWGCPTGETAGANQANLVSTDVTHLIVHHSFSPGNNVTDWPAAVRGVWSFHVNSNGWSDVGYNWLIAPNGVIFQGRAWVGTNEDTQGAHFCGTNRNTMGVCMLGNYSEIPAPEPAIQSLVRILAYRASQRNIDPLATVLHANSGKNLSTISGHRDGVCSTECPGDLLYPVLPDIRRRVDAALKVTSVRSASVVGFVIESIAPNPLAASVPAVVRVSVPAPSQLRLVVVNALGQELFAQPATSVAQGTHDLSLPTQSLGAGAYWLRVDLTGAGANGNASAGAATLTAPFQVVR
jgi:hypothetical protein